MRWGAEHFCLPRPRGAPLRFEVFSRSRPGGPRTGLDEREWKRSHEDLLAKEEATRALAADRGVGALGSVWTFLDLTPFGRQEEWEDTPPGRPQTSRYTWWRMHDAYEPDPPEAGRCLLNRGAAAPTRPGRGLRAPLG